MHVLHVIPTYCHAIHDECPVRISASQSELESGLSLFETVDSLDTSILAKAESQLQMYLSAEKCLVKIKKKCKTVFLHYDCDITTSCTMLRM